MMQVADPRNAPEMLTLRESIRAWRFYDHFRTDADAPARSPQIGTYTPVLSDDGSDIAAAIETIRKFGDGEALNSTVEDAFVVHLSLIARQEHSAFRHAAPNPSHTHAPTSSSLPDRSGFARFLCPDAAPD
jgi:predicted ATPase